MHVSPMMPGSGLGRREPERGVRPDRVERATIRRNQESAAGDGGCGRGRNSYESGRNARCREPVFNVQLRPRSVQQRNVCPTRVFTTKYPRCPVHCPVPHVPAKSVSLSGRVTRHALLIPPRPTPPGIIFPFVLRSRYLGLRGEISLC